MSEGNGVAPFTSADLDMLTPLVSAAWRAGRDRDWGVPAGTLAWSCLDTANHMLDAVLAVAFFLAFRKQDGYPEWDWGVPKTENVALLPDAVDAVGRMLSGVVVTAPPGATAVIWRRPQPTVKPAADFAARGALELVMHGHDVCAGLGVPFEPPADVCLRLREHTRDWVHWTTPGWHALAATGDPWGDLLDAAGRARS